jgi:RNA polymerase sigma factor (sigma-70 family)
MVSGTQKTCNTALQYCQDNYPWLVTISRTAMRMRKFPNYMEDGKDVAQTVCGQCAVVPDEVWATAESQEAFIRTRVRWEADRLYRERNKRPVLTLDDKNIPPDRPHRNLLILTLIVKQALESLPPDKRAIVEGSILDGLTDNQLAELLGITPAALRKRKERVYRDLRNILNAGDAGPPPPA